jgi:two-component system OmpR family response regulator
MSVILLADDSPHAQRMGERILREEGYQVVCVADGEAAALRLPEADPDVVIADAHLPGLSGLELCRYVKSSCRHVRVILTVGLLEELDEAAARGVGCDAVLRKPFEASVVMRTVTPLAQAAQWARKTASPGASGLQPEEVRAAVARAVEAEMPRFLEEVTQKVLLALGR